ncbi:hypothetical protein JO972_03375 [Verrucomicrobiaceae bacterium 5K15]|uniref:KAP NTPase domain-containing protein n=1 Tax=Oceaniferula flava TaxID=2800421 RepID=A0AAE2SCX8_9BACT|nr:hypothetical protein [Oceaniferula flavus]MBK1853986.1 hypothetical protein [Oceaniferula flavus]MBM1135292.1 hypothetical protein [Oceaniferula flavus]
MTTSNHLDHIDQARNQISQFLKEPLERVLVIRGSYGSGKSYFLRDDYLTNNHMPKACPKWIAYTSVFGVNSLKELQLTIAGSLEGRSDNKIASGKHQQAAKLDVGLNMLQKLIKPFIGGVNIELSATSLIWAIARRAGMLLVIDDIDRNSGSLKLNDLVGFVSSMTEHSRGRTKAILILHDDELSRIDKDIWAKLREKVVDREITFAPDIQSTAFHYVKTENLKAIISEIHVALGSHNIRTMLKTEALVNRAKDFFKERNISLFESEQVELVKTASIYYHSGVDFSASALGDAASMHWYPREKELPDTTRELLGLIEKLDYFPASEFTGICLEFFKTGDADCNEVEAFRNHKLAREKQERRDQIMRDFWRIYNGDFSDKEKEIKERTDELFENHLDLLSPHIVSEVTDLMCYLGYPTEGYFRAWVDHHKGDTEAIARLARISDIFPKELEPVNRVKSSPSVDLKTEFLTALIEFNKDDRKFFSHELRAKLTEWTINDYKEFFLKVRHPDLLVSIRTLFRINWSGTEYEDVQKIVTDIRAAVNEIAATSKLNHRRVEQILSLKLEDDNQTG